VKLRLLKCGRSPSVSAFCEADFPISSFLPPYVLDLSQILQIAESFFFFTTNKMYNNIQLDQTTTVDSRLFVAVAIAWRMCRYDDGPSQTEAEHNKKAKKKRRKDNIN